MKTGRWDGEDSGQRGGWRTWAGKPADGGAAVPHLCGDKPGRITGERERPSNPGFQRREIKPQNLWVLRQQEKLSASQESLLERPQAPRMYTKPLTWESAPKGPNLLVGSRGSD